MIPTTFQEIPLAEPLQRALAEKKYTVPSPIQAQAIPLLLEGHDLLGSAQTGTGKTAAFSLPILDALHRDPKRTRPKSARVLVLTPTRELAGQVGKSLETYGAYVKSRHALIFGGVGQRPQVNAMRQGVDVLVACPGRLIDLMDQGYVDLSAVEFFVLDEVDRMLDMGFQRDVQKIVSKLPKKRQSLFFSATMAPPIVKLAREILNDPKSVTIEPKVTTSDRVTQNVCMITKNDKLALTLELLAEQAHGELTMIFARTKHGANRLAKQITDDGFAAEAIHGNRSQAQRDRTLAKFKAGDLPVLVATDVAARGVDVKAVTLVINFDLPNEPEAYVHRIGRTGRAGATGHAVSFCAEDELEFLQEIEKLIKKEITMMTDHAWHLPNQPKLRQGARALPHQKMVQGGGNRGRQGGGGGQRRGGGGGGQRRGSGGGGGGGQRRGRR